MYNVYKEDILKMKEIGFFLNMKNFQGKENYPIQKVNFLKTQFRV